MKTGKKLTQAQANYRRQTVRFLIRKGLTHQRIAGILGCSRDSVTYYANRKNDRKGISTVEKLRADLKAIDEIRGVLLQASQEIAWKLYKKGVPLP